MAPSIIGGRASPNMKPGTGKHLTGVFNKQGTVSEYASTNVGSPYKLNPGNGSNKDPYPLAHGKQFEATFGVGSRVNPCKTIGGNTSYVSSGDPYDKFGNRDTYELAHGKQFGAAPAGGGYGGTLDNTINNTTYNVVGDPYKGTASRARAEARGAGKGLEVPRHGPSKAHVDRTIGGATSYISVGDTYDKLGNRDSYELARGKQFVKTGTHSVGRMVGADSDAVFEAQFMSNNVGDKYTEGRRGDYTDYRVCQRLSETVKKDGRVRERASQLASTYVAAQGLPTLCLSRPFDQPLALSPQMQAQEDRQRAKLLKKYPKLAREMERDRQNRSPTRQMTYTGPDEGPQLLGRCSPGKDLDYAPLEVSDRSPSPR